MIWGGILTAYLAGVAWLAWLYLTAPHGWQDATGYHDGHPPTDRAS